MKMLVNRATGLVREPIDRPSRRGKTAKDHANGNPARRRQRQEARAAWQQTKSYPNYPFPT